MREKEKEKDNFLENEGARRQEEKKGKQGGGEVIGQRRKGEREKERKGNRGRKGSGQADSGATRACPLCTGRHGAPAPVFVHKHNDAGGAGRCGSGGAAVGRHRDLLSHGTRPADRVTRLNSRADSTRTLPRTQPGAGPGPSNPARRPDMGLSPDNTRKLPQARL